MLVVAVTAGYRGWMWWQERQAAQAGDRFMAALSEIESGDRAKGEAELAAIAAESGAGYSALARLRLAGEKAAAGDKPAAIAAYDAVAADAAGAAAAARSWPDEGGTAGARHGRSRRREGAGGRRCNAAGNPWRHAAREVIGTAAYQSGELQAARDVFTEIQQDAETPQDLWMRSGLMVSLIDGQLAAPGSGRTRRRDSPPDTPPPTGGEANQRCWVGARRGSRASACAGTLFPRPRRLLLQRPPRRP